MADREPEELNDGEFEIKFAELEHWLFLPVTQEYRRRVLAAFDHQNALLGATPGDSVDRYMGRAEVLDYILKPYKVLEE